MSIQELTQSELDFLPLPISVYSGRSKTTLVDAVETDDIIRKAVGKPFDSVRPAFIKTFESDESSFDDDDNEELSAIGSLQSAQGSLDDSLIVDEPALPGLDEDSLPNDNLPFSSFDDDDELPSFDNNTELPSLPTEFGKSTQNSRKPAGLPIPSINSQSNNNVVNDGLPDISSQASKKASGLPVRPTTSSTMSAGLPALDSGSIPKVADSPSELPAVVGSSKKLSKADYEKKLLENDGKKIAKRNGWVGPFIAFIVVVLLAAFGYFGFNVLRGNSTSQNELNTAQADYASGGKGIVDQVGCADWQILDDGTTKTFSCRDENKQLLALVSQGLLDDKTVWTNTAKNMNKNAFVVTDHKFWGVLSTDKNTLSKLSALKSLPICDLKKGETLFCPVN